MLSICDLHLTVPSRTLLAGFSLEVPAGTCVALTGPSGSGKTTLLKAIAGLHRPAGGKIVIGSQPIWELNEGDRSSLRLRAIGFVPQFGGLLFELNVIENVMVPLRLAGVERHEAQRLSRAMLRELGIEALADQDVENVSGGEMQRVALARALVHRPVLLLADEPTGALDEDNVVLVTHLIHRQCRERGIAAVIATHDPLVAQALDRVVPLRRGTALQSRPSQALDKR